jgi:hypothetical protein
MSVMSRVAVGGIAAAVLVTACVSSMPTIPGMPNQKSSEAAAALEAPPVKSKLDVGSELAPDKTCAKPREQFNITEKLMAFGDQAAVMRLKRLVMSDFKYSDLTSEDKEMLEYLAKTTMWIPPSVEVKLAQLFALKNDAELSRYERKALKGLSKRLENLQKNALADYPAEVALKVDGELETAHTPNTAVQSCFRQTISTAFRLRAQGPIFCFPMKFRMCISGMR